VEERDRARLQIRERDQDLVRFIPRVDHQSLARLLVDEDRAVALQWSDRQCLDERCFHGAVPAGFFFARVRRRHGGWGGGGGGGRLRSPGRPGGRAPVSLLSWFTRHYGVDVVLLLERRVRPNLFLRREVQLHRPLVVVGAPVLGSEELAPAARREDLPADVSE